MTYRESDQTVHALWMERSECPASGGTPVVGDQMGAFYVQVVQEVHEVLENVR
jgi:hypothetical protein